MNNRMIKFTLMPILTFFLLAGGVFTEGIKVANVSGQNTEKFNTTSGAMYSINLEKRRFLLFVQTMNGPKLYAKEWKKNTLVVKKEQISTFEGLSGTFRAHVYIHKDDQVQAATSGNSFWFRSATLLYDGEDEGIYKQDERHLLLTLVIPKGDGANRDVKGIINGKEIPLRLGGGNRSSVSVMSKINEYKLKDGFWKAKVHELQNATGVVTIERIDIHRDSENRTVDDPKQLITEWRRAAGPKNLRVVWTEMPQRQAAIVWDSVGEGVAELQLYESEPTGLPKTFKAETQNYPTGKLGQVTHCHSVFLKNLKPSTKYILIASVGSKKTRTHYFLTAPDKDSDFKLFFAGDSRSNLDKTREVSKIIKKMFEEDPTYIGLLHGGDFANGPITPLWDPWLAAYYLTTSRDGRLLPIIPVRGNHEGKESGLFDLAYASPGQPIKNYYTCKLSSRVAIVILNSMQSAFGEQKDFLEKELMKLHRKKTKFQLVAYHIPVYPAIKAPHRSKQAWVPLFEEYSIDLALESDGHCIKRTVPIRNDKKAADGVVYLGEGGYGAPQRTRTKNHWYLNKPGFIGRGEHIMVLSFNDDRIEYFTEQLGEGRVDSATFKARKR